MHSSFAPEAEATGLFASDIYYPMPLYLVELSNAENLVIDDEFFMDE